VTSRAEASPCLRRDRRLLGLLLLVCAGSAIATLPVHLVDPGWIVAFVLPAALYAALGAGWPRLLVAILFQFGVAAAAYTWLGALRLEAALALSLLPPLTFFTLRRHPHDTGLALFLSFCFLLIGTMLSKGQSDWRLLVFLCAGGLAMQVEASTRASLVRHAHRAAPPPRWALGASRTQIMALMLLVGSLLFLGLGAIPRTDPGSTTAKPTRDRAPTRRTVGLSHEFDLTGVQGSPLRIEADRVLLATAGDFQPVPSDLYLRMTYFDKAGRDRWATTVPPTIHAFGGNEGHLVTVPAGRNEIRSLSIRLEQPMSGGELFVPPGVHRIRGVDPLEVHTAEGWFRAPKPEDNRSYWVEYQRSGELAHQAHLQDRQDPRLTSLPRAFKESQQLAQLVSSFTRGLTHRSTALERAGRIAAGLQARCHYALREPSGEGADPLHRFLFGSREGYCMHFATALAVMLRLQHIPCRIAVGFYGGELPRGDPDGMSRVFGTHHAHAWVEIPAEKDGWKAWAVVDATPPADRTRPGWPRAVEKSDGPNRPMQSDPQPGACMFRAVTPLLDTPLGFLDRPLDYAHTLALLAVLVLLGVLWSGVMLLRERRTQRTVAGDTRLNRDSHRAKQLLGQILRVLARQHPRPRNCTLEGYLKRLTLAESAVHVNALARGFYAYQEVRFGSRALDAERLRLLQDALAGARQIAV